MPGAHRFSPHHLWKKTVFVSVCALDTPAKDQLTVCLWVYFCVLSSVLFLSMSVFIPIPYNFIGSGSVIYFEIQRCDPSSLVLLSQDHFGYSGSFVVPYRFYYLFSYFCKKV